MRAISGREGGRMQTQMMRTGLGQQRTSPYAASTAYLLATTPSHHARPAARLAPLLLQLRYRSPHCHGACCFILIAVPRRLPPFGVEPCFSDHCATAAAAAAARGS